jgi:hypothetical protein
MVAEPEAATTKLDLMVLEELAAAAVAAASQSAAELILVLTFLELLLVNPAG